MSTIKIVPGGGCFLKKEEYREIKFERADYMQRLKLLEESMERENLDYCVIYGDREHFANLEYFCGYECRFEEALFVISKKGEYSIIAGNEGLGATDTIDLPIKAYLYQNFSLQGQPRKNMQPLFQILSQIGLQKGMRLGVVGYKYFNKEDIDTDPLYTFDIPAYILDEFYKIFGRDDVVNATQIVTGIPSGIRMALRTAKEIAWAEMQGNRVANVVISMFENLTEDISEFELTCSAGVGFEPQNIYPTCNFGYDHVRYGFRWPDSTKVKLGEPAHICYSLRGSASAKVAIGAYDYQSCDQALRPYVDSFYKKHYEAVCAWYETAGIGITGGELYDAVMKIIGSPEFNVILYPGHYTGMDEWSNAGSYKGSNIPITDGTFMQADIISSNIDPARVAICEDAVVFASKTLRDKLKAQYPETYARIIRRQNLIRDAIGIHISDDLLPMSNLTSVYFPFMLNCDLFMCKE